MNIVEIQNKIKNIKREVEEFHPLLEVLFRNMDSINNVENTHGNNEFGADFVLSKTNDILSDTEYIGVIVKIGTITQKNLFDDVRRQIQECSIPRYIENGKKQIFLSEIWIVTNEHITENAKKAIHTEYNDKNLKFISNDKLAELIHKFIPYHWEDVNISEADLLSQIRRENEEIDKSLTLIQTEDKSFYIEQEILEAYNPDYNQKSKKKRNVIDIFKEIQQCKFILIEGGMGAGKSKLLRHLTKELTEVEKYNQIEYVPININFLNFEENYELNFDKLLEAKLKKYEHSELVDRKYIFLIDGFDEKRNDKVNRLLKIKSIHDSIQENKNWKVVLTSRFLSGFVDGDLEISFCKRLEIAPLNLNKTIKFLEKLCNQINLSARLIEDLKKSPLIKELPRSPISAILLAELLNENSKDLPSNLTELYSKYLELMLGRWDTDKGIGTQKEFQVSERIIKLIAIDFIENNLPSISIADYTKYFEDYISQRSYPFTAKELSEKVLKRSNILKTNVNRDIVYFSHRTFAEYYYAKSKVENKDLEINNRIYNIYWMNIYFFYIGLIEDCPEVMKEVISVNPVDEPSRWLRVVNMSNYFLAGYSTPYKIVEENIYIPILDAAKLFTEIKEGKIKNSPFSSLSEITLLWWIQYSLREAFSYNYFTEALDSLLINIEDKVEDEDLKVLSMFFTAVIFKELGNDEAIEYFLEKYRNTLPLNLKFGIFYEGKNLKKASKHFKKQLRNIRRSLSETPKNTIEDMHKKAIANIKS